MYVASVLFAASGPSGAPDSPRLILPKVVWAAVGVEVNIYFDNVVLSQPGRGYQFTATCKKGTQEKVRWTFTPAAGDVGDTPLKLEVKDSSGRALGAADTTLRVAKPNAGEGNSITYLPIGDSLTEPGVYTARLQKLFGQSGSPAFSLIGTNKPPYGAVPGNVHEGYSGWSFKSFLEQYRPDYDANKPKKDGSSPFLYVEKGKPVFSFARYVKEQCGGVAPDVTTIFLGGNDFAPLKPESAEKGIDAVFDNADRLLAAIRSTSPTMRIGLVTMVPPAAFPDSAEAGEKDKKSLWDFRQVQHRVVERLYKKYGGREDERLYLIPAYLNLDCVNNYPYERVKTNPALTFYYGLHPKDAGYVQFGDSIYAWMKNVPQ